jgi:hypothetical protein
MLEAQGAPWNTPTRGAQVSSLRTAVQLQQLLAQTKVLRNNKAFGLNMP